jgi:hypothetical protein
MAMAGDDVSRVDWSDREIDLIVADHLAMLRMEIAGQAFVKSHRNKALQLLIHRSHASIEFKHCNISAVLERLGMPTIAGYKPRANFQKALIDGIERHLGAGQPAMLDEAVIAPMSSSSQLSIVDAPSAPRADQPATTVALERLLRKFDPAERDAHNRALGANGEERVFHSERHRLIGLGREDLARRVRWVAREDGDGAGYDIRSYSGDGRERLLEVKTTLGHERTPFHISSNELRFADERPDAFILMRVYDFARNPRAFELRPPLGDHVRLRPTSYQASFQHLGA